jgi:stage II sporulation protein D
MKRWMLVFLGATLAASATAPEPSPVPPQRSPVTVRVLLAEGSHFEVGLPQGGDLIGDRKTRHFPASTELRVEADGAALRIDGKIVHHATLVPAGQPSASHLHFLAEGNHALFTVAGVPYRGTLTLDEVEGQVHLLDEVDLEAYLYGVVPRELNTDTMEAEKAQAVVSRTYVLGHLHPEREYDVASGVEAQAYGGFRVETIKTRQAVDQTAGQVLSYRGVLARQVCFHATCGGETAANEDVFDAAPVPYLRRVTEGGSKAMSDLDLPPADPYCECSPYYRWTVTWDQQQLEDSLRQALKVPVTAGSLIDLRPVALTAAGRVEKLEARFTGATEVMSGDAIRRALTFRDTAGKRHNLYSTWFTISHEGAVFTATGRGWGHGVGMCQWGAIGMARQGHSYDEILRHYFPGTDMTALSTLVARETQRPCFLNEGPSSSTKSWRHRRFSRRRSRRSTPSGRISKTGSGPSSSVSSSL